MTEQFERVHRVEQTHWWFVSLRELVARELSERLGAHARVLDAGCGTGAMLAVLPASWERTGVDINPTVLELVPRDSGIEVVQASVNRLPFEDDSFDAVVSLDVIYHRDVDERAALQEFRRVLRPGGLLVMNLPAYGWLRSAHDVAAQTARRYRVRPLRAALRQAGLTVERISYRVTFLFPLAALRRLLTKGGAGTDVGPVAPALNRVLLALMRVENALVRRVSLPFGLSVFTVARRD